jgi:hypothetical protein
MTSPDSPSSLFRTQYEFAARIRDPENATAPVDVETRRMDVYQKLFYNNIQGFIRDGFPVLRKITDDETWHERVRDFFARHRCQSPYFVDIAKEFVDFLAEKRSDHPDDPPFLLELAHYEWVELALRIADDDEQLAIDKNGDLLDGIPVVSPVAWPLSYKFPVHRITPEYQPVEAPDDPSFLVVYRDREDKVRFLEINAVTYRLLELLGGSRPAAEDATGSVDSQMTGRRALQLVAEELEHPNSDEIVRSGETILNQMRGREIIIGTARS